MATNTRVLLYLMLCLLPSSSYGVSPSIYHSKEPSFLPLHTPSCIYTGIDLLINGSLSNTSAYQIGSAWERKVACGNEQENVLLRLRLSNVINGRRSHGSSKEVELGGGATKKMMQSLLQELWPVLKMRYRWAVVMSAHYWIEYHTVNAMAHVLSAATPISMINASPERRNPHVGDSGTYSGFGDGRSGMGDGGSGMGDAKGGMNSSNSTEVKRRRTVEMGSNESKEGGFGHHAEGTNAVVIGGFGKGMHMVGTQYKTKDDNTL